MADDKSALAEFFSIVLYIFQNLYSVFSQGEGGG